MDFTSVQRSHVEQALADLAAGVSLPGFRDSTTYDVVHQGRPFPPKLLIALALKHATGQVVTGAKTHLMVSDSIHLTGIAMVFSSDPNKRERKWACASSSARFCRSRALAF